MKKIAIRLAGAAAYVLPFVVLAQAPPTTLPTSPIQSIDDLFGPTGVVCNIFRYLFFFLILLAVVFILLAAYKYVTSSGDPEKVKGANKQILFAAIAVIIAFIARVIPSVALTLLGGGTVSSC